jgi:hypothetical protein
MSDYDDDESGFFSFLTPLNMFVGCAVLLLITYIGYEKFYKKSSVSMYYICFAIIGIILGIFAMKWFGRWSSIIEWTISAILTLGTAFFYYAFLL